MMVSPMVLLRLTWRPLTLLQVAGLVVFYIVLSPVRPLGEALQAVWYGTATPHERLALWHALIVIPGMAGLTLGYYRLELQHTMMSWPLPALRRGLVTGAASVAMPLALIGSLLMLRNADASLAIAAFAVALSTFALGWFLYDVAVPWPPRAIAVFILLSAALSPAWLVVRAETRPLLATALALAMLPLLMSATLSVPLARRRVLLARYFDPSAPFPFTISGVTRVDEWTSSLATQKLMPWIRAAIHESKRRYPRDYIVNALIVVLLARVTGITIIPVIALCTGMMAHGTRLHELWYPLSRAKRASVAYGSMLVEAVTYAAAFALMLALSYALPLPTLTIFNVAPAAATPRLWVFTIGAAAALSPIAQWARLHWSETPRKRYSSWRQWAMFWRFIIFFVATSMWIAIVGDSGGTDADARQFLLMTAGLAAGMQLVSWYRVRQHYLHADLVKRSG
jgi:hypothetical protein